MIQTESFNRLVAAFRSLPGVGSKTALRYAYKIIDGTLDDAEKFSEAVISAKKNIRFCSVCGNYTEGDICEICATRPTKTICVVAHPKDIDSIEKAGVYDGAYHVIGGTIDLQKGINGDKLRVRELVARVEKGGVEEVILAINHDEFGDLTGSYIAMALKPYGVKVSRLAYGMSTCSEIEYTDPNTLLYAIRDRKPV